MEAYSAKPLKQKLYKSTLTTDHKITKLSITNFKLTQSERGRKAITFARLLNSIKTKSEASDIMHICLNSYSDINYQSKHSAKARRGNCDLQLLLVASSLTQYIEEFIEWPGLVKVAKDLLFRTLTLFHT